MFCKVGDKEAKSSAVIIVPKIDTHVGKLGAFSAQSYAGQRAHVSELTIVVVVVQIVWCCVVGDEDGSTPITLVRELSTLIPAARFEVVIGAGHLPCIEKPDVLCGLIDAHVREAAA